MVTHLIREASRLLSVGRQGGSIALAHSVFLCEYIIIVPISAIECQAVPVSGFVENNYKGVPYSLEVVRPHESWQQESSRLPITTTYRRT